MLRLVDIRDTPLDLDEVMGALDDATSGGVTVFVGRVRDHDGGQGVTGLEYSAHPSALATLRDVCAQVAVDVRRHGARRRPPHRHPRDRRHRRHLRDRDRPPGRVLRRHPGADRHAQGRGADLEAPVLRRRHRGVGRLARRSAGFVTGARAPSSTSGAGRPYPRTGGDPPLARAARRRDAARDGVGVVAGSRGPRRGRPRGSRPAAHHGHGEGPAGCPTTRDRPRCATAARASPCDAPPVARPDRRRLGGG